MTIEIVRRAAFGTENNNSQNLTLSEKGRDELVTSLKQSIIKHKDDLEFEKLKNQFTRIQSVEAHHLDNQTPEKEEDKTTTEEQEVNLTNEQEKELNTAIAVAILELLEEETYPNLQLLLSKIKDNESLKDTLKNIFKKLDTKESAPPLIKNIGDSFVNSEATLWISAVTSRYYEAKSIEIKRKLKTYDLPKQIMTIFSKVKTITPEIKEQLDKAQYADRASRQDHFQNHFVSATKNVYTSYKSLFSSQYILPRKIRNIVDNLYGEQYITSLKLNTTEKNSPRETIQSIINKINETKKQLEETKKEYSKSWWKRLLLKLHNPFKRINKMLNESIARLNELAPELSNFLPEKETKLFKFKALAIKELIQAKQNKKTQALIQKIGEAKDIDEFIGNFKDDDDKNTVSILDLASRELSVKTKNVREFKLQQFKRKCSEIIKLYPFSLSSKINVKKYKSNLIALIEKIELDQYKEIPNKIIDFKFNNIEKSTTDSLSIKLLSLYYEMSAEFTELMTDEKRKEFKLKAKAVRLLKEFTQNSELSEKTHSLIKEVVTNKLNIDDEIDAINSNYSTISKSVKAKLIGTLDTINKLNQTNAEPSKISIHISELKTALDEYIAKNPIKERKSIARNIIYALPIDRNLGANNSTHLFEAIINAQKTLILNDQKANSTLLRINKRNKKGSRLESILSLYQDKLIHDILEANHHDQVIVNRILTKQINFTTFVFKEAYEQDHGPLNTNGHLRKALHKTEAFKNKSKKLETIAALENKETSIQEKYAIISTTMNQLRALLPSENNTYLTPTSRHLRGLITKQMDLIHNLTHRQKYKHDTIEKNKKESETPVESVEHYTDRDEALQQIKAKQEITIKTADSVSQTLTNSKVSIYEALVNSLKLSTKDSNHQNNRAFISAVNNGIFYSKPLRHLDKDLEQIAQRLRWHMHQQFPKGEIEITKFKPTKLDKNNENIAFKTSVINYTEESRILWDISITYNKNTKIFSVNMPKRINSQPLENSILNEHKEQKDIEEFLLITSLLRSQINSEIFFNSDNLNNVIKAFELGSKHINNPLIHASFNLLIARSQQELSNNSQNNGERIKERLKETLSNIPKYNEHVPEIIKSSYSDLRCQVSGKNYTNPEASSTSNNIA